ncbi:MAG: GyrI-like domain-containing protein [Candidatus Cloacimonetes bacterium]|nr:GyrI-like domain-containing protein [Candidatus Cloacimonadota bacterium]
MPDYENIIKRSLNFIEKNLSKSISNEDIADYSGYSPYHYARIFSGFTGFPIVTYIRMRKLSEAAIVLIVSGKPIEEISKKFGFESQEVFTRAFKKYFQQTPSLYRKNKILKNFQPKLELQIRLNKRNGGQRMNYKITELPNLDIIGIKIKTKTKDFKGNLRELWDSFLNRINEIPQFKGAQKVGICFHDPRFVEKEPEQEDEWFYMAGIMAKKKSEIPKGMIYQKIPASKYAVFSYDGSKDNLHELYRYISVDWISSVEYEFYPHDELEMYNEETEYFDSVKGKYDLMIPIK